MRRALLLTLCLLAARAALAQPEGDAAPLQDDPRAVQILEDVRDRYEGLQSFYARMRQVDLFYGEWRVTQQLVLWEEMRKRPNRLWTQTIFPQELADFGLSDEQRMLGEEPPAGGLMEDEPLRYSMIKCDGTTCWSEYYSLLAMQSPLGSGQEDTENMAAQDAATLYRLKEGDPWPTEGLPDIPITVAQLMDGRDIRKRIVPGSINIGRPAEGAEAAGGTEPVLCKTRDGDEIVECHHLVFLVTNGLEQHWWVRTDNTLIAAERVLRVLPPAPDPFLDPEPEVELPADFTDLMLDRVGRIRRYMTGRYVRTDLFYDYLQTDFPVEDSEFTYTPNENVAVVGPSELFGGLNKIWEITTGRPGRPAPPEAAPPATNAP